MKKLFLILLAGLLPLMAQAAAKKRPNILFIIADDQSPFDFKTYNPASELVIPNTLPASAKISENVRRGL